MLIISYNIIACCMHGLCLNQVYLLIIAASGSMINANHGNDSLACPGEELVYTCVSTGESQRWHIINQDGSSIVHFYLRTDPIGVQQQRTDRNQNLYTFDLISTAFDNFVSTVSVVAALSMHNTRLECHSSLPPVSTVIKIAGNWLM